MLKILKFAIFAFLLAPLSASAAIDLSGTIRNDAMVSQIGEDRYFTDLLETALVLQRPTDAWKFYSDVRVLAAQGDLIRLAEAEGPNLSARLLRAFVKLYTDFGDWTLGKTYINFGIPGVFNPFEIDRGLNVTDLSYTKSGLLALTGEIPFSQLGNVRVFASPEGRPGGYSAGAGAVANWAGFDWGAVAMRQGADSNLAGLYFKGDLELGVQGALAWHLDDRGAGRFVEALLGADYSFYEGRWLAEVQAFYSSRKAGATAAIPAPGVVNAAATSDNLFQDGTYLYVNLAYVPDEFFQAGLYGFVKTADRSSLIVPSATWVVADGLKATLLALLPTGGTGSEFSREALGRCHIIMRVEAKL